MWLGVRDGMAHAVSKGFTFQMYLPEQHQIEATIAYLSSLTSQPSPWLELDGKLTASAERGKEIFNSEQTACIKCHTGELLTDRKCYVVGTRVDPDRNDLFDTPSLIEIYRTAPYLHDGSAATLREVLVEKNREDKHGKTSHLTPCQIDDLTEYLKSL